MQWAMYTLWCILLAGTCCSLPVPEAAALLQLGQDSNVTAPEGSAMLLRGTEVGDLVLQLHKLPALGLPVATGITINPGCGTEESVEVNTTFGEFPGVNGEIKFHLLFGLKKPHEAGELVVPISRDEFPGSLPNLHSRKRKEAFIRIHPTDDYVTPPLQYNIPPTPYPTPLPPWKPSSPPIDPCDPASGRLCKGPSTGWGTTSSSLEKVKQPRNKVTEPDERGMGRSFNPKIDEDTSHTAMPEDWGKGEAPWAARKAPDNTVNATKKCGPFSVAPNDNPPPGGMIMNKTGDNVEFVPKSSGIWKPNPDYFPNMAQKKA